ncbi:10463_t:CDS:2, partial [Dentiscutata heterogama]
FGNQPVLLYMPQMVAIEIIKDVKGFFAEIMAGGRGFGHPDYDGMSDSDTNLNVKKDGSKTKRKSNEEYIEAQLQAYISRLKSDKIPINIGIKQPNSADHEQWSAYIKEVKKFSEEMKHNAEWTFV